MAAKLQDVPREWWLGLDREPQRWFTDLQRLLDGTSRFTQQSSDPSDPPSGEAVMWVDSASDLKVKITDSSGTTKTTTLVDFSAI